MAILNLDQRFPIVDPKTGQPTDYFMRMLRGVTGPVGDAATDIATLYGRNLTAGNGLTGGGDLTADRSFAVGAGTGITVNTDDVAIDTTAEAERIRDVMGSALVAGSNITITPNDGADTITIAASGGSGGGGYEAGPATPPTTADLAIWLNQDASTATNGADALVFKPEANGQLHSIVKAAPSAPFTLYCRAEGQALSTAANTSAVGLYYGIVLRDSADSEVLMFGTGWDRIPGDEQNVYVARGDRWTGDGGAYSASGILKHAGLPWKWFKVEVPALTGATLTFSASMDGRNWVVVGTETTATFIDSITHIGVGALASTGATEAQVLFSYFSTTAPS